MLVMMSLHLFLAGRDLEQLPGRQWFPEVAVVVAVVVVAAAVVVLGPRDRSGRGRKRIRNQFRR